MITHGAVRQRLTSLTNANQPNGRRHDNHEHSHLVDKKFNTDGKQHGTIKALLKNFILPETEMAIKENQSNSNKCIYSVPAKPPLPTFTERMKSLQDAKQAFLNSTVSSTTPPLSHETSKDNHTVHYAQIAITTDSEDTRSTGGGKNMKHSCATNNKEYSIPINVSPSIKKTVEQHQRKVSFKIKNATTSHKRPPLAKTMTITSSKVAELTKKFNNLQTDTHNVASPKQSKLVKTLEELQSASRCSASNSSTPSSTLSSSPNIKIVLRQRRSSKKRHNRKRCSSMDSMEDLTNADSSNKIRVIRSKSDGTKMAKASKKRLKYQDSSEQPSGSDSVDGSPVKIKEVESKKVIKDNIKPAQNEPHEVIPESQVETNESRINISTHEQKPETDMDFESNLVEACNKEIIIGYTSKPKQEEIEDYYEPLEPRDEENVVIIPIKNVDRSSKINCPLPEIPKTENDKHEEDKCTDKENIYQCLLEMRSHPEGDESSLHNYELCENELEERTRGDGDSDDGYEYCKSPIKPYCVTSSAGIQIAEGINQAKTTQFQSRSERIYEKIPARPPKSKDSSPTYSSRHSFISDYTVYNENENIYDTIKHGDAASLSHCYESIPNSPSMVKLRGMKKQVPSNVQKRLSFDTVSNISQSTMSSEQKTNSLYGQRSVISYNGQEIAFQVPSSETSVSDRSDRSDDWVDVSDEEKNEQKIIIVRERSRGRKSPISWSQKVRHQWQKSPKPSSNEVFVTSPTKVYIDTSAKCSYYSQNDERTRRPRDDLGDRVRLIDVLERTCRLDLRTVLQDGEFEIQDLIAFFECDSSDSGHLYESLEPAPTQTHPPHAPPPIPIEEDFDSFDSDSDTDDHDKTISYHFIYRYLGDVVLTHFRLLKVTNQDIVLTVAMDGKPFTKSPSNPTNIYDTAKKKTPTPIYANCEKQDPVYTNINFKDTRLVQNKTEIPLAKVYGSLKEELKTVISDKRASYGDVPPPLPDKPPPEKPVTPTVPTNETIKKDSGTLSRKAYFSFKSRFRRATSLAVDINSEVPSALKITNSTFYLTDSMDGDSGFSNCSDNGQPGSTETLSPESGPRRRDGRRRLADSSPCLCPVRPALPPPPPPPAATTTPATTVTPATPTLAPPSPPTPPGAPSPPGTDFSAVNEELKRLLPTLSRKDKSPRARTSWYAECGADTTPNTTPITTPNTSNTSWYAEAGLYQAGNISSSSGASSGSHPASPLPHSLFTHEPLYQFYNAAKVESVCRDTGDSDSDAYEAGSQRSAATSGSETPARPSAMALVAPRGPSRTLWCSLAPAQKRLQEAKFELLTSEASYLNSLNVLEANFIAHPAFRDPHVLPRHEWETLFATILPVRKCSQLLMTELEKCWQENILLQGICDIVRQHAELHFSVYVKYCENQALMVKALQRLQARPAFVAALKKPVRWLVRSGEMTQLIWKSDELKLTFGKKFHKVPLHLFLFNDLLVIAKKKGETEWSRWAEALQPPTATSEGEAVYAGWDCPQVCALYAYAPAQPDELPLAEGDVVNVTRRLVKVGTTASAPATASQAGSRAPTRRRSRPRTCARATCASGTGSSRCPGHTADTRSGTCDRLTLYLHTYTSL
ncbi:unnamed protein product [Spodoptera littoralis]|uniref:DH domain-containing protein n=1 Tax=Spodoptera littoralis TaxID=7109 RepID=A0A9P0IHG9_SPOLI|nr:unnamed protein product [Spodoptera littoralis]CAH1646295.1 unnamed protein product [Spodoptera littoralis]